MTATMTSNVHPESPAPLQKRRGHMARAVRSASRVRMEALETRTLMSATWNTVDALSGGYLADMAADSAGNIYAVGNSNGVNGTGGIVREKAAGSDVWTTILQNNSYSFKAVTVNSTGALYVAGSIPASGTTPGQGVIYQRFAGQSAFTIIDSGTNLSTNSMTVDAAGDLYIAATASVPNGTTTTGSGKNKVTTTNYLYYGTVRKGVPGADGQLTFSTVLAPTTPDRYGDVTVVNSGPAAGVYLAGYTHDNGIQRWLTLKSVDGGASWSQNLDPFALDTTRASSSFGLAADANGNLYAAGFALQTELTGTQKVKGVIQPVYSQVEYWITRKSTDGGTSWTTVDQYTSATGKASAQGDVGVDPAGNVYVVGWSTAIDGTHAIVRSNATIDGSWTTVDDVASGDYTSIAVDPTTGAIYVGGSATIGGQSTWVIRSSDGLSASSANASVTPLNNLLSSPLN